MQQYILAFSKYVIAFLLAWYTLESFLALQNKKQKKLSGLYFRQRIIIFLIQFLCFISLTINAQSIEYLFFYAFVQVFIVSTMFFVKALYEKVNCLLLNNMCMLLGLGFVLQARFSMEKAIRQLSVALIALLLSLMIPVILNKVSFLRKLSWLYASVGIICLMTVLILGEITHGSKLSFSVAGITFQTSEFIKIVYVFFLAAMLYEECNFTRVAITTTVAAIHVIILVFSRDLGSALIFFAAYLLIVFIASGSFLYLSLGILAGGAGACSAYFIFDHVRVRVMAWREPFSYIDNQGYQITQSLFAISSGDWFGLGLGSGVPGDIPYVETDFIFSALCEELGVICGICVLLICISSFLAMMVLGLKLKDKFYRLIAAGLGVIYLFQIFLTVGGGIKFIPLTGVTLPFISYGGSSILTTIVLYFIVMALGMQEQIDGAAKKISKVNRIHKKHTLQVVYGFTGLFLVMIGYLAYFTVTKREELINNSYNSRQELLLTQNYRGAIYSADGQVLAQTVFNGDNEERIYPFEELFSHVVGYSTRGKTGMEAQANYYLINSNITFPEKVANELAGRKNPGDNVWSSLDVDIQRAAYRALDNYRGAIIVTEPSTGRILALVSKPDYNPNDIVSIWDDLVKDSGSSILLNRASCGLYPPGSTFKIITALAYIRQNPEAWADYVFDCPGYYNDDGIRINCHHRTGHGVIGFTQSFAKSCNSSFVNMGMQLSRAEFTRTVEEFGFNRPLPVKFTALSSHVSDFESITDAEMMQTVIGQGKTQITPLHLNMITSAIANGGVMMNPYLIDRVQTASGKVIKTFSPSEFGTVMTKEEAAILTELMKAVVLEGTATGISGLDYNVAGKTGSAEYGEVKGESHAWFTGFAPVDNPQICVTVIVEGAGSGGDYAVPMAKRVFSAYFDK